MRRHDLLCVFIAAAGLPVGLVAAQPCAPSGWTQLSGQAGVPARSNTVVAQGPGGSSVMFGGYGSGTTYGDTWVFNGAAWTQITTPAPSPRNLHVMAYDASRQRTVLVGGQDFGLPVETWEWDGATWQQASPATNPPALYGASLGYDGVTGRVLLVGGTLADTGEANSNVWAYDGQTWTDLGAIGPNPRLGGALAYDSARQRLVLFGGVSATTYEDLSDTWEFDGSQWGLVDLGIVAYNGGRPPSMAYDPTLQRLVLTNAFGHPQSTYQWDGLGWAEVATQTPGAGLPIVYSQAAGHVVQLQAEPSQTWSWDGSAWSSVGPASIPALNGHAMVFNAQVGKPMVFGGVSFLGEEQRGLWQLDASGWTRVSNDGPDARDRFGLTYDSQRGRLVLFGGYPDNQGETWTWSSGTWSQVPGSGPSPRQSLAMAYDSARDRVVVFGGQDPDYNLLNDTWQFDGAAWTQATPAHAPAGRDRAAMAYDPARHAVVLFGGRNENYEILGDTWQFDGTDWSQIVTPGAPPARYAATMTYDASIGKLVLIGGLDENYASISDVWVLDQANGWQRIQAVPGQLGGRTDTAAAYDASRGRTVLYGGFDDIATRGDTWSLAAGVIANITQQPQSASLITGDSYAFVIAANADRAISYQWTRDGSPVGDGPTGNGSTLSGATSPTLNLTNAQAGDSGRYACIISTECGQTGTDQATLTVCETAAPVIASSPTDLALCPTSSGDMTVNASGQGPSGLRYEWQASYLGIDPPQWFDLYDGEIYGEGGPLGSISGSYLPTITFGPTFDGSWLFTGPLFQVRCIVISDCGSSTSGSALLTILDASDPSCGGTTCDPDVNQDGVADQGDVDYLINVIAGGENPTNIDPDFNRDGVGDQGDIDALINVIAGGPCP
ncbi:MAG: hypothetical protein GC200_04830 [Tepidisphaera sp.]|nr:hypothetical protein [Tepidisphaera sp.]